MVLHFRSTARRPFEFLTEKVKKDNGYRDLHQREILFTDLCECRK